MKDLVAFSVFLLIVVASELAEDYRAESCVTHGHRWVREPGCKTDWCDFQSSESKR